MKLFKKDIYKDNEKQQQRQQKKEMIKESVHRQCDKWSDAANNVDIPKRKKIFFGVLSAAIVILLFNISLPFMLRSCRSSREAQKEAIAQKKLDSLKVVLSAVDSIQVEPLSAEDSASLKWMQSVIDENK